MLRGVVAAAVVAPGRKRVRKAAARLTTRHASRFRRRQRRATSNRKLVVVPTILMIPGYENSGPQHWQTLWQNEHPEYKRVEQRDWLHPECNEWVNTLDRSVAAI